MDSKIQQITTKLEILLVRRSRTTSELSDIDSQIENTVRDRNDRQEKLSEESNTVKDSARQLLAIGDYVETVTRGKYIKRKGKVTAIDKQQSIVTLKYIVSKKETWRKGHNLRKYTPNQLFAVYTGQAIGALTRIKYLPKDLRKYTPN